MARTANALADVDGLLHARKLRQSHRIAWLMIGGAAVALVSNFITGISGFRALVGPGAGLAGGALSLWLLARGRLNASAKLLLLVGLAWSTWASLMTSGSQAFAACAYVAIGAMAGWLLGWRAMLGVMALSLAVLVGMATPWGLALLAQAPPAHPQRVIVGMVIVFVVTFTLLWMVFREGEIQYAALRAAGLDQEASRAQLRASEQRYAALFTDSPAPLALLELESGRYMDVNRAWTEHTGYAREQVVGRTSLEFGLLRDPAVRDPMYRMFREQGHVDLHEITHWRPDGAPRVCLTSGRRIAVDGRDAVIWGFTDVTDQRRAHLAILDNEARFRQVFDNASDAMWLVAVKPDGRLEYETANRAHAQMTGLAPERLAGRTPHEAHPGRSDAYVEQRWRDCLAAGKPLHYEEELPLPGGARKWHTSLVPVRDVSGAIHRIVGVARDVTDQRRGSEELSRFRAAIDISGDAVSLIDRASLCYIDVNRTACELVGYAREELVGMSPMQLFSADRATLERDYDAIIADNDAPATRADGWYRHKNGTLIPIETRRRALRTDDGWVIVAIARDVTERKRAEEALRASRALLETVVDAIPMNIFAKDLDSRYVMVNRHMAEFFGLSKEQVLQRHTLRLPASLASLKKSVQDDRWVYENRRELDQPDVELSDAQGRPVHFHSTKIPLFGDHGELAGLLGVNREITAERAAKRQIEDMNASLERSVEQRTAELKEALDHLRSSQDALLQSEKLAALGRLVAGVAHELNTPIGNSLLTATTLAERTASFGVEAEGGSLKRSSLASYVAQAREASEILHRNLEKAADLIRSFKQVAADQTSSQRRAFALDEVMHEVLLAHRPMLKTSPILVRLDVPVGIRMDSYPGPLGQVLGNLITNGVLHGYDGERRGTVTVSARVDAEDWVEVAVRDQGRGISEADLKRIFDPFFTTRMGRGGTGLGLGICHNIVTGVLGGSIRVASRLGEGASFILRLPLAAPLAAGNREAA